jgi:hypothetical protein
MIIIIMTHLCCSAASACLPPAALQGYVLTLLRYGLAAAVSADALFTNIVLQFLVG